MSQASGSRLLIIAVVCGVVAAGLSFYYLKQIEAKYKAANAPKVEVKVGVVVPSIPLKKGDVITKEKIAAFQIPQEYLPSGVVMAKDYKFLLNKTMKTSAETGKPIIWSAVSGSAATTFSENIELGKRATTFSTSKVKSFDGLLRPGDHIDIYGNFKGKDLSLATEGAKDEVTLPVLEDVVVIAAGKEDFTGRKWEKFYDPQSADGFNMNFTTVTVQLSPRQVAKLEMATRVGDVIVMLRHPKDTSVSDIEYVDVSVLTQPDPVERIDVVMGADGKPIGRIIGDNVVDENGNIIGKVVDGKPVTFDGRALGTVVKNVDPNDPALRVVETADVVRDANGNVIGKVVDGQIIDANGRVIGRVDENGNAIGMTGEILGVVETDVALDANGNVVDLTGSAVAAANAEMTDVVRDADGNVIGIVDENGQIVDANGNVVGTVDENGNAVSLTGESLGTVETVMMDDEGNVVGETAEVVRDSEGNVIGVIDANGNVVDEFGNVVGRIKDGQVIGANGEVIASGVSVAVESEVVAANLLATKQQKVNAEQPDEFIDFIAGGNGKDGVIPVSKVMKE